MVIPTFDRVALLREALDSVRSQTYPHWEAIVVDDGSRDGTREYLGTIGDRRITHLLLAHSGVPSIARNAGTAAARGSHIALLDADDTWDPRKVEIQLQELLKQPQFRWSYTNVWTIRGTGPPEPQPIIGWTPHSGWILEHLIMGSAVVSTPTVLAERDLLLEVGGFDETLVQGDDYDLWFRLAMRAQSLAVDRRLTTVRRHAGSLSHHWGPDAHEAVMRALRKVLPLGDRTARRLCRQALAGHAARLADAYSADGQYARAVGAFFSGLSYGPGHGLLWRVLPKLLLRPVIPSRLRAHYRRRKDTGAGESG